jgi:hypothetical protein
MSGFNPVTGLVFDLGNCMIERTRRKVQLNPADTTNQMMMVVPSQLIGQVTTADLGRMDDTVSGQKFQRSVDGGFGHTGLVDALVDLRRGEMPAMMQGLQDGEPLRGHSIAAFTQGLRVVGKAGHRYFLIAKIINNNYMQ